MSLTVQTVHFVQKLYMDFSDFYLSTFQIFPACQRFTNDQQVRHELPITTHYYPTHDPSSLITHQIFTNKPSIVPQVCGAGLLGRAQWGSGAHHNPRQGHVFRHLVQGRHSRHQGNGFCHFLLPRHSLVWKPLQVNDACHCQETLKLWFIDYF